VQEINLGLLFQQRFLESQLSDFSRALSGSPVAIGAVTLVA